MTIWFVSRHPGALQWAKKNHIAFDKHVTHLDSSVIETGDKVIGTLPINLAAEVCRKGAEYWHLSLLVPASARGQELSAKQLEQFDAKIERFIISRP